MGYTMVAIEKTEVDGVTILRVMHSELTASSAPTLFAAAREQLGDTRALVLDLQRLTFIDSSGIGQWLLFVRHLQGRAISVRMAGPGEHLMSLVRMMHLERVMSFSPDVDTAVRELRAAMVQDEPS
jgi:anti-anti-sigma factor